MEKENMIVERSKKFAIEVGKLSFRLAKEWNEFNYTTQIRKSASSIGANASEGECGQSRADFLSKYSIARKECNETLYWLDVMHGTGMIPDAEYEVLKNECTEIFKILSSICKTTQKNIELEEQEKKRK